VLFVGRFEKRKGIDILLDLIPGVLKRTPSTIFRLVGPDPNKYYQSKFRNEHPNFINNVFFIGEKRGVDLDNEYKNCDVFIAPSRYESFGLIYAEAMSFSKPVIGTNIGGIPEVVEHGKNGFLCQNENIHDFSNKLTTLLENKELRYQMGMVGRERAKNSFDFQNLVTRTEEYYQHIIRKSKT
jgi:glycosyltransferase involved in cell wall biosynthesis